MDEYILLDYGCPCISGLSGVRRDELTKKEKITNSMITIAVISLFAFIFILEAELARKAVVACGVVFEKDTFIFWWLAANTIGLLILGTLALLRR